MTFSSSTAMEEHAVPLSKCCTDVHAQLFKPESENTNPFQGESKFNASAEGAEHQSQTDSQKKKKKKKAKKSTKPKESTNPQPEADDDRPSALCISRNKHWRYISSYHGPWLQLPLELLESLLILNLDPNTLTASETRAPQTHSLLKDTPYSPRSRGFASISDHSSPDSPRSLFASLPPPPPLPSPKPGKATPPPIDPGVFRSVAQIRRLIDEASELSVRASSGLSAAALGSLRRGTSFGRDSWNAAQLLGLNGANDGSSGRHVPMSANRIHRLRVLAVQKLAEAYKADEIASSVMVMQGGSVFDDIADRVLKVDPNDVDARYVQFFHEKIPSRSYRQLAESTTTHQLDRLIAAQPHRLEFFRTRGIVHCFRDEYAFAVKDFTHALRESRAQRKARAAHRSSVASDHHHGKGSRKKTGKGASKTNGQAPPNGTSAPSISKSPSIDGPNGEPLLLHPSVLPDAPDPIEPQCVFLRGAAYLQHAVYLIEDAIFRLEGVRKQPSAEGGEIRLCYIENGKYGGLEVANPDGPLGSRDGAKLQAYRNTLANSGLRDQVTGLIKKALRDHEKFLSYFDTLEGHHSDRTRRTLAEKAKLAFHICENMRPTSHHAPPPLPDLPVMFTTYHPLLVESHFSVLICQLLLGDFISLVPNFYRAAQLVDGLEGYPVFLPPRSMAQAEFVEVLERLASGWKNGIQPHTLSLSNELALVPTSKSNGKGVDRSMLSPIIASATSSSSDLTIDTTISGSSSSTPTYLRMAASGSSCPYDDISGAIDDSSPSIVEHSPTGGEVILSNAVSNILVDSLDYARMLLVPVAARQREKRIERSAVEKASINGKRKPMNINIPLHGPRVEVLLAWVGAVHLYELDSVA